MACETVEASSHPRSSSQTRRALIRDRAPSRGELLFEVELLIKVSSCPRSSSRLRNVKGDKDPRDRSDRTGREKKGMSPEGATAREGSDGDPGAQRHHPHQTLCGFQGLEPSSTKVPHWSSGPYSMPSAPSARVCSTGTPGPVARYLHPLQGYAPPRLQALSMPHSLQDMLHRGSRPCGTPPAPPGKNTP